MLFRDHLGQGRRRKNENASSLGRQTPKLNRQKSNAFISSSRPKPDLSPSFFRDDSLVLLEVARAENLTVQGSPWTVVTTSLEEGRSPRRRSALTPNCRLLPSSSTSFFRSFFNSFNMGMELRVGQIREGGQSFSLRCRSSKGSEGRTSSSTENKVVDFQEQRRGLTGRFRSFLLLL